MCATGHVTVSEVSQRGEEKIHHRGTETTEKSTSVSAGGNHASLFVDTQFFLRLISVTSVPLW